MLIICPFEECYIEWYNLKELAGFPPGGVRPPPPLSTTGGILAKKKEYIADFAVISAKTGHFKHSEKNSEIISSEDGPPDPPPLLDPSFQTFLAKTLISNTFIAYNILQSKIRHLISVLLCIYMVIIDSCSLFVCL